MDDLRNHSEEPLSSSQEEIRKLRKDGDEVPQPASKLPDEVEFVDLGRVMSELVDVADVVPDPLIENPLGPPPQKRSPVQQIADVPLGSLRAVQGAIIDDLAQVADKPSPVAPEAPQSPRKLTDPQEFLTGIRRPAEKRAEHGRVMVELAENARRQVPDAEPVAGFGGMDRGEMERLTFQGGEGADTLVDAYKRFVEADKDWRATLAQLLHGHAAALRQMRLELDLLRGYLERDCI